MRAAVYICVVVAVFSLALGTPAKKWSSFSRHYRSSRTIDIDTCLHKVVSEGTYRVISNGEVHRCPIYMLSPPDKVIAVEINEVNIDCKSNGHIVLFDGWESQEEYFPDMTDSTRAPSERVKVLTCESSVTDEPIISESNAFEIMRLVPNVGEGFTFTVRFIENPEPCNTLIMEPAGAFTLRNNGKGRNCSAIIMHPEKVEIVNIDIGTTRDGKHHRELGFRTMCMENGERDYVEFFRGNGMQVDNMVKSDVSKCGAKAGARYLVGLPCNFSVVRLVSSGAYLNSISVKFEQFTEDEFKYLVSMGYNNNC